MSLIEIRGGIVEVDREDEGLIGQYKWRVGGKGYVVRNLPSPRRGERVLLHREILERMGEEMGGKQSDHKNRNKLDNRRENLRAATSAQNNWNRKVNRVSQSQVKGVRWRAKKGRWEGEIKVEGRVVWRKAFRTKAAAEQKRREVLPQYHGEFARM